MDNLSYQNIRLRSYGYKTSLPLNKRQECINEAIKEYNIQEVIKHFEDIISKSQNLIMTGDLEWLRNKTTETIDIEKSNNVTDRCETDESETDESETDESDTDESDTDEFDTESNSTTDTANDPDYIESEQDDDSDYSEHSDDEYNEKLLYRNIVKSSRQLMKSIDNLILADNQVNNSIIIRLYSVLLENEKRISRKRHLLAQHYMITN